MIEFLIKFWKDATATDTRPGYWTSVGDIPVFIHAVDSMTDNAEESKTLENLK